MVALRSVWDLSRLWYSNYRSASPGLQDAFSVEAFADEVSESLSHYFYETDKKLVVNTFRAKKLSKMNEVYERPTVAHTPQVCLAGFYNAVDDCEAVRNSAA